MPTKHGVDKGGGKFEILLPVLCLKKAAFLFSFLNNYISPGSSNPRADHSQSPSAIFITSFHPQFLYNGTSSFKSTKKSKSKPALHRSLSYIQKIISSFSLSHIQKRISSLKSLCLIITVA